MADDNKKYIKPEIMRQTIIFEPPSKVPFDQNKTPVKRLWWHSLHRTEDRYPCYAVFLILQGDKEVIAYLKELSKELNEISGRYCLIIALSDKKIQSGNTPIKDEAFQSTTVGDASLWDEAIDEQNDHSIEFGKLFGIDDTKHFPCLLLFKNVRDEESMMIPLKDLTTKDMIPLMRLLFQEIRDAVDLQEDPLEAAQEWQKQQHLKLEVRKVKAIAGRSLEKALEIGFTVVLSSMQ